MTHKSSNELTNVQLIEKCAKAMNIPDYHAKAFGYNPLRINDDAYKLILVYPDVCMPAIQQYAYNVSQNIESSLNRMLCNAVAGGVR